VTGRILPGDPGESSAHFFTIQATGHVEITEDGLRKAIGRILQPRRTPRPEEVATAEQLRAIALEVLESLNRGSPLDDAYEQFREGMAQVRESSSRPAIFCQCGAMLLESGWRGRANVLCEICSTTWGVDAPETGGYSRWQLTTPEPTSWHDAARDRPDDVARWEALFFETVEALGGTPTDVARPLRLELSKGVIPPWLRLIHNAEETGLVLRPDASIDPWIQATALHEIQRQRRPESSGPVSADDDGGAEDTEDDYVDFDELDYEPLAQQQPELAAAALDRYTQVFTRLSQIDARHVGEVRTSLSLDVSVHAPATVLRATSHFTGETRWQEGWDGSLLELVEFAEGLAETHAHGVHTERHLNGPTPWDVGSAPHR
jgi:hypothetical protein